MGNHIYVRRDSGKLGHPLAALYVRSGINKTLRAENISVPCTVNVLLTDNEGIREINREFRNVNSATDVLSFPMNDLVPGSFSAEDCERDMDTGSIVLGDMMLSVPRCAEQGKEFGHGFKREMTYLAVHSTLHLLGYDHVDEGEMKKQMRTREKIIMGDMN